MAAFYWPGGCPDPKPRKSIYIKPQPAIYLHNADELLAAINEAQEDTVCIKKQGKRSGYVLIDLWYAKALYERIK